MKLTIDKVTKSYGSNKALDMFSAELEAGIYALLWTERLGKIHAHEHTDRQS